MAQMRPSLPSSLISLLPPRQPEALRRRHLQVRPMPAAAGCRAGHLLLPSPSLLSLLLLSPTPHLTPLSLFPQSSVPPFAMDGRDRATVLAATGALQRGLH